jgi:signal transduction histidine kinase
MFKRIGYRIALQFTAFVFLLLMINGAIFLAVDFSNARRQTEMRLQRMAGPVIEWIENGSQGPLPPGPPMLRERIRILESSGEVAYIGSLFPVTVDPQSRGFSQAIVDDEQMTILTAPPTRDGRVIQIAEVERWQRRDMPMRIALYLIVSVAVSALTFFVGLFFARRSLQPAEQMMERLEQFTQDASHELRTPLAALLSSLDLALLSGEHREGILSAKQDVKDITVLVERLLELARLDGFAISRTSVDFSSLVEDAIEKFRPLAQEKGLTIEQSLQPDVTVVADTPLIRQVVTNLLSNAIKFSHKGSGPIFVRLTAQTLSIQDHGIGIAPGALSHIFDRFFRADPSRTEQGFGLGLALVRRILDLHGWTIRCESAEGRGTTMTVSLRSGKSSVHG